MGRVSRSFKPPIPPGSQIYAAGLFVAGVHVEPHRAQAVAFARGREQELALVPEPTNQHDPNAVKVIGNYKGLFFSSRAEAGYVPRDVAEALAKTGLLAVASVRLKYVSVDDRGQPEIEFDIVGPKERKREFDAFFETKRNNEPISNEQKEFASFFGMKLPKGATFGLAKQQIDAKTEELKRESPTSLDDWDAYWTICDELDDAENRENYSLKKVSRKILRSALDELKKEGITLRQVADNIDIVAEKIIATHPDLEREP